MFGSSNSYFFQSKETLLEKKEQLKYILSVVWKRPNKVVDIYLDAYDYFCKYPNKFDGATIVSDIWILPNLDIFAMLHDYLYIKYNVAVNVYYKLLADYLYCTEMRKFKVSWTLVWVVRFLGLSLSGLLFIPYTILIRKKTLSSLQKKLFKQLLVNFNINYEKPNFNFN